MTTQEHIDHLSPALKMILENEISAGNEIDETSRGWPHEETIMIFLKRPFTKNYTIQNITYRDINDIHYWKAEYFDERTRHVLACKF